LGGPRFDYSSQSKLRVEVRICDSTSGSLNRPTYPKIEMKKKTHRVQADHLRA